MLWDKGKHLNTFSCLIKNKEFLIAILSSYAQAKVNLIRKHLSKDSEKIDDKNDNSSKATIQQCDNCNKNDS